jgi:D-alanine-D-alanine ligase
MAKKIRVAVLFGGKSNEHSISVASAGGVMGAIDASKYEVIPVGITKKGEFVPFDTDPKKLALSEGLKTVESKGESLRFALDGSRELFAVEKSGKESSLGLIDVVFPVLHGQFGEDGTIQGYLELAGIPYVGNGVLASAVAMDKEFSKTLFKSAGIPTPDFKVVTAKQMVNDPESALEKLRELKLPVFVKPARAGSSVGITKVKDFDQLAKAVTEALAHDDKVVVEVGVVGREIECAVLEGKGDEPERVSVAGEIVVKGREFYDFEAKYLDSDAATLICPAEISDSELKTMQQLARKAFRALGCEGLARVDFFLTKEGFMLNEINTMPGFTSISMFPRCFKESGLSFTELVSELIELALEN